MECNLGNLVVDIMRHVLDHISERKVDCTMVNGGTLRSDTTHKKGMLTKRDLLSILPMMDEVAVVEITGQALLRALEVGVSSYPKLEGRFLHVCTPICSFTSLPHCVSSCVRHYLQPSLYSCILDCIVKSMLVVFSV